jgi:hypothetical protein
MPHDPDFVLIQVHITHIVTKPIIVAFFGFKQAGEIFEVKIPLL